MIAIIDYGMGNIHSVQKALEALGAVTSVVSSPLNLEGADKIVLPGVGAFDDAAKELKDKGLISAIKEIVQQDKPFLGICLGLQLLFLQSEEAKKEEGLGILKGEVKKFSRSSGLKIPHMGWNELKIRGQSPSGGAVPALCPLLKDIPDNSHVYFCHSYYPVPKDEADVAATTEYGVNFASVVWRDNVYGVQFHPEKSQSVGMQILKNFIEL